MVVEADETDPTDIGIEALLETLKPDSETVSLMQLAVSLMISPSGCTFYRLGLFAATNFAFCFNCSSRNFFGSSGSMYIPAGFPVTSSSTIWLTADFDLAARSAALIPIWVVNFSFLAACLAWSTSSALVLLF